MTCEEALVLLSGHLDGTNTKEEAAQLREHLDVCAACRDLLEAFQEADQGLLELKAEAPEQLCENVMQAIRVEAKPKKMARRWRSLAIAAGLLLVIGFGAMSAPEEIQENSAVLAARQTAAPVEYVEADPAYDPEKGFFYYDHTVIIDPQTLAEERGADVAVTHELFPEMEVCSCEILENGSLLYQFETTDGAVQLSRGYGVELYQPANGSVSDVSYALLTP